MSITYLEAIREAQAKLLRDDDRVFIYGQDVGGTFGGAFKATKGLATEFPGRVLNTPISEDAIVGTAIGAAMQGMRPIVEMQFADFSSIALNQILNNAGTHYWRTGVPVPITVRLPSGGTKGSGPFHSQSMESLYAHYPGLIVMTPATVEDAYTMLIEAVAIDDPVVYCEHKYLYYHLKADKLPDKGLPTGRARITREGRDLTIVSYSAMTQESLAAAEIHKAGQRGAEAARYLFWNIGVGSVVQLLGTFGLFATDKDLRVPIGELGRSGVRLGPLGSANVVQTGGISVLSGPTVSRPRSLIRGTAGFSPRRMARWQATSRSSRSPGPCAGPSSRSGCGSGRGPRVPGTR